MSETKRVPCTEPGCRSELLCHERHVDNLKTTWRCLEHRPDTTNGEPTKWLPGAYWQRAHHKREGLT